MPLDPLLREAARASWPPRLRIRRPSPARRRAEAARAEDEVWERAGLPRPEVAVERVVVPVPDRGVPDVPVRIHRPPGATGPLPAVVTFFGGAFRQGSNDSAVNRWAQAHRALAAGVAVVAVDYALAPEHRFPVQIRQGLAVLDLLAERGAEHGVDPGRLAVGGQSSGGCIAASVAQANLDAARHPLRLQLLEVPILDLTGGHLRRGALAEARIPRFAVRHELRSVARDYLGSRRRARDPRASPLLRRDLAGLPPAVILAAECDPLRGDAVAYHARLREAGVPSSAVVALGQTHDSSGMPGVLPAARLWQESVVAALRTLHD